MLEKIEPNLKFDTKRNFDILTPCCNSNNKDGKFVNYKNYPIIYGYCHSCGKAVLPPTIYVDKDGVQFIWNEVENRFENLAITNHAKFAIESKITIAINRKEQQYIEESIIWKYYNAKPENNLLQYLRNAYGDEKVNNAKETYALGTSKDGGIVFWNINSDLKVQKGKIAYYNECGKRTNKFKVPYKNEDGYYYCLFGEHLICESIKNKKTIVLVESEKTAIVGYILLPKYVWAAYGGINGLTENKLKSLIGHKVLIIPDMSENAVSIIVNKIPALINLGIHAKIWDMTEDKTDEQLKNEGVYNSDLEDVFRKLFVKNQS